MSTIKQIAHLAGVSRGTVDRVLNNRGSVNPETAAKIKDIANAINYSPNRLGKTLAIKKKNLKFGYILFSSTSSNPFFEDVVAGIESKSAELEEYGVSVETRYAAIDNPALQVQLIDELLELGADGFVITPINHPLVVEKLKQLTASGVPIVTTNSDIPDCGRIAYVGSDYYKSGQTAGGLMNLATAGRANVGIIIGSEWVLCHSERVAGFTDYLNKNATGIKIIGLKKNNDDDLESYLVTKQLLEQHPEIDSLFLASAGVMGACRAVSELGLAGKLTIVSYDTTRTTRKLIQDGVITATIAQQPFTQGAKPLDILLEYVGMEIPPAQDSFYTKIEIKIKENL